MESERQPELLVQAGRPIIKRNPNPASCAMFPPTVWGNCRRNNDGTATSSKHQQQPHNQPQPTARQTHHGQNEKTLQTPPLPPPPPPPPPPTTSTIPPTLSPPSPAWLNDNLPLPRLIVLDLDYTLWPFYSDIHPSPPLRLLPASPHSPPTLSDRNGEHFALYPDAPHILRLFASPTLLPNTRLAVASKSPVAELCREILKSLRLPATEERGAAKRVIDAFEGGLEIYEGSKLRHFEVIAKRTGVGFADMLFFDDERPNLEVEKLGVTMRLIRDGLTWEEVERGIRQWRENRGVV